MSGNEEDGGRPERDRAGAHGHGHAPDLPHGAEAAGGAAHAGEAHGHSHGLGGYRSATARHRKRLLAVLAITLSVLVVEVAGAALSGSLALLADAGHMLTDAAGVAIALIASVLAARPASPTRTFGLQRLEVLAALVNGLLIAVIAIVILIEAVQRLTREPEVQPLPMIVTAVVGGLANLAALLILRGGQKESINVRGAYLEVLGDLLGSIAVVAAGIVVALSGWRYADPIASILIAVLIAPRAYSLLAEVVRVLLEATPRDVDLLTARKHLLEVPGVVQVHDLHAWTITSGVKSFSAHVVVEDAVLAEGRSDAMLDSLNSCLSQCFGTEHSTFQLEPASHGSHEQPGHA